MAEEAGEWKEQVIWDEKQQKIRAERVLNLGRLSCSANNFRVHPLTW